MNKAVSTLTAATAGMGLAVASTSAKAFIIAPAVAAAALAGGILGGAVLGSAATNAQHEYPTVVTAAPVAVAPGPAVTVNSTTCYFTHRWINHVRRRVEVCNGPAGRTMAPAPLAAAPVATPTYAYGYGYEAVPAVIAPPGYCEVISGNRVCF